MQETQVQFLGRKDALEKETATHSSILAWRIPWTEGPGRLLSIGLRVRHDLATKPLSPSLVNWEKAYTLFFYFHCNELFFPVEYYTIAPILQCYKRI